MIGFFLQIPVNGRVWVFLLWRSGVRIFPFWEAPTLLENTLPAILSLRFRQREELRRRYYVPVTIEI